MRDFVNYCLDNNLIEVDEDGTVTWREDCMGGKAAPNKGKGKFAGGRDQTKDLSGDYKGYCHHMGTVWPFKLAAKGGKKQAAPVAK